MSELNLTGQSTLAGQIQTRVTQLRNAMELRKEVWNRLPVSKKKSWITSGKDPIMTLAYNIYVYLKDFFEEAHRG